MTTPAQHLAGDLAADPANGFVPATVSFQAIELKGSLLPFGWAKLLLWLRKPKTKTMRVPLMGVLKRLQSSRLASQLATVVAARTDHHEGRSIRQQPDLARLGSGKAAADT